MNEQEGQPPRGLRAVLDRFRDRADLKEVFVSIAVGYLGMELVSLVIGPLAPFVFSFGGLLLAFVTLYGVVPVLRRGRWRR